jgi:hypothetical protein
MLLQCHELLRCVAHCGIRLSQIISDALSLCRQALFH